MKQTNRLILSFLLVCCFAFGGQAKIIAYFPKDQLACKLIEVIDKEKSSIKVAAYAFTHRGIAEAIVRAKERGVMVEVILDPFSIKKRVSIQKLLAGKVPLFVWDKGEKMRRQGKRKGIMHNQFCVFGNSKVWTGSFNFTYDAVKRHRENVLLIEDRKIASAYLNQFMLMQLYETKPYSEYITLRPKKKGPKKAK